MRSEDVIPVTLKKPVVILPDAINFVPPATEPAPMILSGLLMVKAEDQVQVPAGKTMVSPADAAL